MSVVGTATLTGEVEGDFETGKYEIRVYYRVIVNSRLDDPIVVCSASGLPELYSLYSGNGTQDEMRLRKYSAVRTGDKATMVWKVTAYYSTPEIKEGKGGGNHAGGGTGRETGGEFENPLLELPVVKMTSTGREKPLTRIYDNISGSFKPCTASNGEVFDPPPRTLETMVTLSITRNEPITANHPYIAIIYTDAVNSDPFFGMFPGIWKIKEIVVERQERQIKGGAKFPFLRVTYSFEANKEGWDERLLDYGTVYYPDTAFPSTAPALPTDITTARGQKTSAPLNGRGQPLMDRKQFTVVAATDVFTVGASRPGSGTLVDGDLVQVANTGGALPAPLREGSTYRVISLSGSTFSLAGTVRNVRITDAHTSGVGVVEITTSAAHGLSAAQNISISGVETMFCNSDGTRAVTQTGINGTWAVTTVVSPTKFDITVTLEDDDEYISGGTIGTILDITTAGSGKNYIWCPGVFFFIRKFQWLPFSFLGLPNDFGGVQ